MLGRHDVRLRGVISTADLVDKKRGRSPSRSFLFINNEAAVDSFESNTHSFVVKIWLEETDEGSDSSLWRGHVTHVPSRQRRYVEDLRGISDFISIYLKQMDVSLGEQSHGCRDTLRSGNA